MWRLKNLVIVVLFFSLISCASKNQPTETRPTYTQSVMVNASKANKPQWLKQTPETTKDHYYFVGYSGKAPTKKQAQEQARTDSLKKAASFMGVSVESSQKQSTAESTNNSEQGDRKLTSEYREDISSNAEAYFSQYRYKEWYIRYYHEKSNDRTVNDYHRASVLLSVPTGQVEQALERSKQKREQQDSLFPDNNRRRIVFRSSDELGQQINNEIQALLNKSNFSIETNRQNSPTTPYFTISSEITSTDQGTVGDVMQSRDLQYTISISLVPEQSNTVTLETITGNHAAIGATGEAAKQRAIKEILQNEKNTIVEAFKNSD